jgi:hypothetical protein
LLAPRSFAMWLAPIAPLLALSAMAPPAETASPVTAATLPEAIATRQTLFAIPFRIDPADQPGREPAGLELYVSGDRGATWDLYSRIEPARRRFMFRAGGDGEFWFLVRTRDRSEQLWPQGPNLPELRVIVDTMPPKLQIEAKQGQAGQIIARWEADDPHLKPDSLTIQYRTTTDGPWQEVALDRRQLQPVSGSLRAGQVIWWPQAGFHQLQIRAEVSDLAGNLAVSHAQVKPGQDSGGPASRTAEASSSGWRASPPGPAATSWPVQPSPGHLATTNPSRLPADQAVAAASQGVAAGDQTGPAAGPGHLEDWGTSEDSGNAGYGYPGYANDPSGRDRLANYRYPDTGAAEPTYPAAPADTPSSPQRRDALAPPTGSLSSSVNPPIQNRYVGPDESEAKPVESGLPPAHSTGHETSPTDGRRPRMVNSRAFRLAYDVTSAGPSGISRVELWGTQDAGRSWKSLAVDDDNRSPLPVQVDQEGIYGLKVVVTSGAGLGGGQPQSGELPEIVVGVDLTKPTARITSARQGVGTESGELIISWQAYDRWPAARPVTLLWSQQPGGPWTTVASGLEDSGRYAWAIDPRAPQRIYLRLEIRDEAGNTGVFEMPEPVSLDRFRPTAQIRDVRAIEDSNRAPATRYSLPPSTP